MRNCSRGHRVRPAGKDQRSPSCFRQKVRHRAASARSSRWVCALGNHDRSAERGVIHVLTSRSTPHPANKSTESGLVTGPVRVTVNWPATRPFSWALGWVAAIETNGRLSCDRYRCMALGGVRDVRAGFKIEHHGLRGEGGVIGQRRDRDGSGRVPFRNDD